MLNRRQPFPLILGVMVIPILLLAGCNRQTSADAGGRVREK